MGDKEEKIERGVLFTSFGKENLERKRKRKKNKRKERKREKKGRGEEKSRE